MLPKLENNFGNIVDQQHIKQKLLLNVLGLNLREFDF